MEFWMGGLVSPRNPNRCRSGKYMISVGGGARFFGRGGGYPVPRITLYKVSYVVAGAGKFGDTASQNITPNKPNLQYHLA